MNIYQHFRPEEHSFIDRAAEWIDLALHRHQKRRTDFLDPRQAYILETMASREPDVQFQLDGGVPSAERKRAVLAPHYEEVDREDFGLAVLSIASTDQRFADLKHGDVMGALLGLGIKRDKLGDIYMHDGFCHCVLAEEIAPYIVMHLHQVHRVQVTASEIALDELKPAAEEYVEQSCSVASLRLDNVLSEAVRMSRAKILQPIKAGDCKVNWKVEQNPAAEVGEGDVLSLRGYGRYRIMAVEGPTKKGRMRVTIGKLL